VFGFRVPAQLRAKTARPPSTGGVQGEQGLLTLDGWTLVFACSKCQSVQPFPQAIAPRRGDDLGAHVAVHLHHLQRGFAEFPSMWATASVGTTTA
jgi:hypothetical protein